MKYALAGDADALVVPAKGRTKVTVTQSTRAVTSTQSGLLLLFDDNLRRDAQAVTVTGTLIS